MPSIEQDYRELFRDLPTPRRVMAILVGVCLLVGASGAAGIWILERGSAGVPVAAAPAVASGILRTEPYPMIVTDDAARGPHVTLLVAEREEERQKLESLAGARVRVEGVPVQDAPRSAITIQNLWAVEPSVIPSFAEMAGGIRQPDSGTITVRGGVVPAFVAGSSPGTSAGTTPVPPLVKSRTSEGVRYYLLAETDGGPLPPSVLEGLRKQNEFLGQIEQVGDLAILRLDSTGSAATGPQ